MQQYTDILGTDLVKDSRVKINNNIKTVGSSFSGAAFPTSDLLVGMVCYRTDRKELYMYAPFNGSDANPWKLVFKFNSAGEALVVNATNSEYVNHDNKVVLPDGTIMWVE